MMDATGQSTAAKAAKKKQNQYEILGVSESADAVKVKEAFRSLILRYHPDKSASRGSRSDDDDDDDVDYVNLIQKAYDILRDPIKRKQYDEELRLERQRNQNRLESAIVIAKSDCVTEECNDDDDRSPILVYPCRCGALLDTSPLEGEDDDEDDDGDGLDGDFLECPGCSLVYDLRELQTS